MQVLTVRNPKLLSQVLYRLPPYIACAPSLLLHRPTAVSYRAYALSRFPERRPGVGRNRWPTQNGTDRKQADERHEFEAEPEPSAEESPLWAASQRPPSDDPEEGIRRLLLSNETLVVTR